MKPVDEYRDAALAKALADRIAVEARPGRHYRFVQFRSGPPHAIFRLGVQDLLPSNVEMVHGPGCPARMLPVGQFDMAIRLAKEPTNCKLFGKASMPDTPLGSRKVSTEGACAAHSQYGRFREKAA